MPHFFPARNVFLKKKWQNICLNKKNVLTCGQIEVLYTYSIIYQTNFRLMIQEDRIQLNDRFI